MMTLTALSILGAQHGWTRQRRLFFFVNKKEAKKTLFVWSVPVSTLMEQIKKVFCFFFSKKKPFLTLREATAAIEKQAFA
ncbi:hypothetical protein [Acidiphilium sp.]|uniref:hypothetical protein n=1 Tax=Acidiphilium sp. TaxID=527 RepID=UPI003CFF22BE